MLQEQFLSKKLTRWFTRRIREMGESYARNNRIDIFEGGSLYVRGMAKGTGNYAIALWIEGEKQTMQCTCTCPYFKSHDRCKHIWGMILEAEKKGFLSEAQFIDHLYMDDKFLAEDEIAYEDAVESLEDVIEDFMGRRNLTSPKQVRPNWRHPLDEIQRSLKKLDTPSENEWTSHRQVIYVIDTEQSPHDEQNLSVRVYYRQLKKNGDWGKCKSKKISRSDIEQMPDPLDRQILNMLIGHALPEWFGYGTYHYTNYDLTNTIGHHPLPPNMQQTVVQWMCQTGRCFWGMPSSQQHALRWDNHDEPWRFELTLLPDDEQKNGTGYHLSGLFRRDNEQLPLDQPFLVTAGGLLFTKKIVSPLEQPSLQQFTWITHLLELESIHIPAEEAGSLVGELLTQPNTPKLKLPDELACETQTVTPKPVLSFAKPPDQHFNSNNRLEAVLTFDYPDDHQVSAETAEPCFFQSEPRQLIQRDFDAEEEAKQIIMGLKFRVASNYYHQSRQWRYWIHQKHLMTIVQQLIALDWRVEAEGVVYRAAGAFSMKLKSGIDWFEIRGEANFGDQTIDLPTLLKAVREGKKTVRLGDGSHGLLPDDWLKQCGMLEDFGQTSKDHVRFELGQTALLDALLATMPPIDIDENFKQARQKLANFQGIEPLDPPNSFKGTLREYQHEGLGWLDFLQKFRFGGCLADDMGLGKTVQVLAMLAKRPTNSKNKQVNATSLIVVPKSLVSNWHMEAKRFSPHLRVLDHTGIDRFKRFDSKDHDLSHFHQYDMVLTTYGTMRRDAAWLREFPFHYAILDEAQMIKNSNTATAKASRLLQADHRLALSGTPIENHLGELWSLFEFLNPGFLGKRLGRKLATMKADTLPDESTRTILAKAIRPFILRRTKQEVAKDLPERIEQTLYCDLEPKQRKYYNELRDYYRQSLMKRVDEQGLAKSKMHVLEALLRLRQAACHPALISEEHANKPSAKLDTLLPMLTEILEEDHKALVFSQFTSFLKLVREPLDQQGIPYEYLDGRTRNRAERIERFQNDPDCKLFLISLKAGGLGLNLTAADYVYLLDPWWNPAVEAQAIDRAHRIGQTNKVIACRLIARDTVEEKVLSLQKTKRELAESIITADGSLMRKLDRDDLDQLLS